MLVSDKWTSLWKENQPTQRRLSISNLRCSFFFKFVTIASQLIAKFMLFYCFLITIYIRFLQRMFILASVMDLMLVLKKMIQLFSFSISAYLLLPNVEIKLMFWQYLKYERSCIAISLTVTSQLAYAFFFFFEVENLPVGQNCWPHWVFTWKTCVLSVILEFLNQSSKWHSLA